MMKFVGTIVENARVTRNTCKDGYVLVTLDYAVKDCTGRVVHVSEKHRDTTVENKLKHYVVGRKVEVSGKEVVEHVRKNCLYHDIKGYGWLI